MGDQGVIVVDFNVGYYEFSVCYNVLATDMFQCCSDIVWDLWWDLRREFFVLLKCPQQQWCYFINYFTIEITIDIIL